MAYIYTLTVAYWPIYKIPQVVGTNFTPYQNVHIFNDPLMNEEPHRADTDGTVSEGVLKSHGRNNGLEELS